MRRYSNWFRYRFPHHEDIIGGASSRLLHGLEEGCFVLSPFVNDGSEIFSIPFDDVLPDDYIFLPEPHDMQASTPKLDYIKEVTEIIAHYDGRRGKTVAARCLNINTAIDLNATFRAMCESYPDAFVFMFSTLTTGTWIGASPELLLSMSEETISTMALAGTRPAAKTGDWDPKNVEEQAMVTEYLVECLGQYCEKVEVLPSFTKEAGKVAHICTPIKASRPLSSLSRLLRSLSPTPALCGSDKKESLGIISRLEGFDREMYGGFCGPCGIGGDTSMYVILRSAKCGTESINIFAGGGITKDSIPEDEWNETELKSTTIINCIKSK